MSTAQNGPREDGIKYHTSDFLKDRHPFNANNGFNTQRSRDAGKVFNGMLPDSIDSLLDSLTNPELDAQQKLIALRHLFSYSAAAERKIEFVRKDVIPTLATMMQQAQNTPQIETSCAQILRSLAILPQAAHAIVEEGGLHVCVLAILDRQNLKDREDARVAAASVISQVASSWCGRNWILGLEVSDNLQLEGRPVASALSQEGKDDQLDLLFNALVSALDKDRGSRQLLHHALMALAHITAVDRGLLKTLAAGGLRAVSSVLESFAEDDLWIYSENPIEAECVLQAVTVVWHTGLDESGKEYTIELPLVKSFARIVKLLLGTPQLYKLKGSISGAACALMLHPPMKRAAVDGDIHLADMILQLLRDANSKFAPLHKARKDGEDISTASPTIDEFLTVMKNSVQTIRLIAELPDGRKRLHELVSVEEKELRRQLFASTAFQDEFNVWVY